MNAFMHQAQSTSATSLSSENCALDVKPTIQNGVSQSTPKQREGTASINNNTSSSNNNSSLNGGGLFDNPHGSYGGYEASGYGGYHQNSGVGGGSGGVGGGAFQSSVSRSQISDVKPQRTKPRTSAGKTMTRCGIFIFNYTFYFPFYL